MPQALGISSSEGAEAMEDDIEAGFLASTQLVVSSLSAAEVHRLNTRPPSRQDRWRAFQASVKDGTRVGASLAIFSFMAFCHLLGWGLIGLSTLGTSLPAGSSSLLPLSAYPRWGFLLTGASLISAGAWLLAYIQRRRQQLGRLHSVPIARGA